VFLHNKQLMYTVRVDEPNPLFANLLLEQFGGANGELAAAMRYFQQAWNEPHPGRRSMLADIATEELSHLEMVGQALVLLMKGTPAAELDKVEGDYLGDLLEGKHEKFVEASATAPSTVLSGGGPAFVDSAGNRFTANWVDTIGEPTADLRSNIAAEARAKITYERLIKQCDDPGLREALTFLMTREIAHQKMFEAALDSIPGNFPPGTLPGDETLAHAYVVDSAAEFGPGVVASAPGFDFAEENSDWGFQNDDQAADYASEQEIL
jgi:Mn-containing catalase